MYFVYRISSAQYIRTHQQILTSLYALRSNIEQYSDASTIQDILTITGNISGLSRRIIQLDKKIHSSRWLTEKHGSILQESVVWIMQVLQEIR